MSPDLKSFLAAHCTKSPAAVMPLIALMRAFRQTLPPDARNEWTRTRLVSELLAAGYVCGVSHKVFHVSGLTLKGKWVSIGGKLELAHA